ncbi:DUF268 domain-containing protein [Trichlorobacter ammonificans]|nr:DUF268 domain-containing protein [Trichlorobacter ammonificans]
MADFLTFHRLNEKETARFPVRWNDRLPCLKDKTSASGFDSHYIYHPAWAARILAQSRTQLHVDISSSLHFCTIVSAFLQVRFYDYRPADLRLSGLTSEAADLLALPFRDESIESLSCMHVVEHVGLGRYGDPLDPDGDLKAIAELRRVVSRGGTLLFVVPLGGTAKILFNAHRIYTYQQVVGYFEGFELREFALVPDNAAGQGIIAPASGELADAQDYGCGCFWFVKPADIMPRSS